jgi:hypothetical protein
VTQQPQTPPGWYPQPDGRMRYWDGYRWTEQYAAGAPPAGPGMAPMMGQGMGPGMGQGMGPGMGPGVGMPPQRSSNKGCWIAAIIVLVLLLGGVATVFFVVKRAADDFTGAQHTVAYSISGTGKEVDISYSEGSGGTSRVDNATLPWTKTVTTTGFSIVSLTASNGFDSAGDLTCKITVDGKVVKESSATGKGSSVFCTFAG